MDLSAAITNGYNIGKDLGYNMSGQAAEDRRLNREMTRAKIDTMQAQADLAQQQAQYTRDDREEQEKMKAYEGVMTLATQAVNNPLMKPQTLKAIQDMQQRFGYSNEWVITDALDDDLRDQEKFNTAAMLAYTIHGKGTNPLDEQNADDFQRVQQGIVKMTNTQTGETQYTHIGDLLYMFGGNYGTAYMHSIIQAKKLKEETDRAKAQMEITEKQFNMVNKAKETELKNREQAMKEQNYMDTVNMHNKFDQYIQNNPNEIKSVSTKDGKYTGYTKYNPDDGSVFNNPEEILANSNYYKAKLAFVQSNNLLPQELGMKITELKQFAKAEKLPNDIVNEVGNAASKYVTKALKAGDIDLAMKYQREINSALGVKVDDKAIDSIKLFSAALKQVNNMTSNNGNPSEAFFDAFGGGDKLRNFFTALTGLIDFDQEKIFDALNDTKNLQSMLAYDMMGKRVTKHGLAQMPTANEWLTGTANLSVIRSQLQKVKDIAHARMAAGDPATAAWAQEAYETIDKMQKQIDDNINFAKVIAGDTRGAISKGIDWIKGKREPQFGDNVIVPIGSNMQQAQQYKNKNIINFRNTAETGDPNKQVEIYLPGYNQPTMTMSASEFNKITEGKYYQFTKDIR